jgi:hypothetical protein
MLCSLNVHNRAKRQSTLSGKVTRRQFIQLTASLIVVWDKDNISSRLPLTTNIPHNNLKFRAWGQTDITLSDLNMPFASLSV